MSLLRKTSSGLIALLLILTSFLALILFNLERKAFTPETYQQAFATDEFYDRLPGIMALTLSESLQSDRLPVSVRSLTPQNWETFLRDLVPPPTIREMGDQALASIFTWLNRESSTARFSLQPIKDRMLGEAGIQAVFNLIRSQPPCTFEEMARIAMFALGQGEISLCNPPEDLYPLVTPLIQGQLKIAAAAIPTELTLADMSSLPPGQADPRERLLIARMAMRISPILPVILLILLTLIAVRDLRSWFVWWGVPILITGFLTSLTAFMGVPLVGLLLRGFIAPILPAFLPPALLGDGARLATAIAEQLLQPVLLQGLTLILVGIFMLALSRLPASRTSSS